MCLNLTNDQIAALPNPYINLDTHKAVAKFVLDQQFGNNSRIYPTIHSNKYLSEKFDINLSDFISEVIDMIASWNLLYYGHNFFKHSEKTIANNRLVYIIIDIPNKADYSDDLAYCDMYQVQTGNDKIIIMAYIKLSYLLFLSVYPLLKKHQSLPIKLDSYRDAYYEFDNIPSPNDKTLRALHNRFLATLSHELNHVLEFAFFDIIPESNPNYKYSLQNACEFRSELFASLYSTESKKVITDFCLNAHLEQLKIDNDDFKLLKHFANVGRISTDINGWHMGYNRPRLSRVIKTGRQNSGYDKILIQYNTLRTGTNI